MGGFQELNSRIVVISLSNLSDTVASGGIVRLVNIFSRMAKNVDLTIVCTNLGKRAYQNNLSAEFCMLNANVNENISSMMKTFSFYLELAVRACLWKIKLPESDQPTIAYAASTYLPDVLTAVRIRKQIHNSKYVQVVHHLVSAPFVRKGNILSNTFAYFDQRISLALIEKYADKIIVVNNDVKKFLIERGIAQEKIELSYNGVDLDLVNSVKEVQKSFDCAFVGRIDPNKGIADLVQIMKIIKVARPSSQFVIIGDGLEKNVSWFTEQVRLNDLGGNVIIKGRIDQYRDVLKLLKGSKVLIFPSREEGFGIVIVEALACGCVPVVWDIPVFAGLFPEGVIRIEQFNQQKFADAVVELCEKEGNRTEILQRGEILLETYNWNRVARKELEIIEGASALAKADGGKPTVLEHNKPV